MAVNEERWLVLVADDGLQKASTAADRASNRAERPDPAEHEPALAVSAPPIRRGRQTPEANGGDGELGGIRSAGLPISLCD